MKDILFSVSMCVYGKDNPAYFKIAADSIIHQTVKPSEVVLVVDGPVPAELDRIISEYEGNDLFRVIRLEKNVGHGNARRIGLENCRYELVALMDADDISVPERFEMQLRAFEKDAAISIVGGQIEEFIDEPEQPVSLRGVRISDREIKEDMKVRCPMNQVTVMFKKTDVQRAGGFIDWYCEEDYYLWLRMALMDMRFANTDQVLVRVRVGADMYQRRGGWKYFISEAKLQKYMLDNKVIGFSTFAVNTMKRLIVQVLLPNRVRSWVFQKFARRQAA